MNHDTLFGRGFTWQAAKYEPYCDSESQRLVEYYPRLQALATTDPALYQTLLAFSRDAMWRGFCDGYEYFSPDAEEDAQ